MHGIINIYKPCGMSSNYVLTILKKSLNIKKLGHLGTLDPLACGVLPVMVNKGTKLFDFYLNKSKVYRAIFTFGIETDTLDSEGKIINKNNNIPNETQINETIKKFIGKINQIPPIFSAKKINGQTAYNLARNGENIELKPKEVEIFDFKLIKQINKNSFLFEIKCSSGTYIRSIARDLAKALNTCAFMSALIRLESGEFNIFSATYVKELTKENFNDKIIELGNLLIDREKLDLNSSYYKALSNGVKIDIDHKNKDNLVIFCNNELIGLGNIVDKKLTIKTNLQIKN
ncbi:MAG: tRNA pseudouridine(55) synthase TruB [Clostridiales bacterium]|nr:tRNA pseudouridine(55) synthase TruB [Clostridiales bacterium]